MDRIVTRGVKAVRRVVVAVVGTTVLLGGLVLVVLPGPAFIVIPIGLGILAMEFAWARRWLTRARDFYSTSLNGRGSEGQFKDSQRRENPDEQS
jgi:uncharacterized protein (TIGR02611 family)